MAHGVFVDGVWHTEWYDAKATGGRFVPFEPVFRNWVTADGSPGPSGEGGFAAEPGRYHLYVSLACPWAHRTLILRKLKKLEGAISVSVVHPVMGEHGWAFGEDRRRPATRVNGKHLPAPDLHARRSALYRPRHGAGAVGQEAADHRQQRVRRDHPHAQFGVRRHRGDAPRFLSGRAARRDRRDQRAASITTSTTASIAPASPPRRMPMRRRSACCSRALDYARGSAVDASAISSAIGITEADWRLFTTLVRFDPVYFGHFKCNLRRIADYPNLSNYLRDLYQVPGVAETVNIDHIKRHYYGSHDDDQSDAASCRSGRNWILPRRMIAAASRRRRGP